MNKELTALECAIIVLITMVIVGFWVLLLFQTQDASQFARTSVFAMVGLTFVVLCVLWSLVIESHVYKKRNAAWLHVIEKTQGVYFYGYPVADCLCSNMAAELRWHHIGDFSRTLGFIVLYALRNDKKSALLYTRRVETTPLGYNDTIIRFYYKGAWWQFSLNRPLNDARRLKRVILNDEKSALMDKGYRSFDFWIMPLEWRLGIGRCAKSDRSFFYPDINYMEKDVLGPSYKNIVREEIARTVQIWHWCERNSLHLEKMPQHVAA